MKHSRPWYIEPWGGVKANTMKLSPKKLCSKDIAPKYYWWLLKTMLNDKKVPCIQTFFTITKLLQILVKKLISLILFLQSSAQLLKITVFSCQYLAKIEFIKDAIKRIICKPDLNKAYGHDMISICMLMP